MVVVKCRLNRKKVKQVAREMGLKRPVTSYRRTLSAALGHYDWDVPKKQPHEIAITDDAPILACPYAMTRTILHELKHAEQYERLGEKEFKLKYRTEMRKAMAGVSAWVPYSDPRYREKNREFLDAYYSNPFEHEAESFARENADKYPHLAELYG